MNTEQLLNQARYQAAMNMAKELLESGIITKEEYAEIDTIMTGKYEPFFGTLFSGIDLINTADRVMYSSERRRNNADSNKT